ncbi:hypothetical protein NDU88_006153 [Pleurodeles waltl]|uniref:Uncharacterized protein n=1 Tax=Pleurodeles waltl TaxID=8319 RepID=A0AAV7WDK7_PLEWA|nr:hypothetical protein NDU88_006153 [Pleurodeles waltl]
MSVCPRGCLGIPPIRSRVLRHAAFLRVQDKRGSEKLWRFYVTQRGQFRTSSDGEFSETREIPLSTVRVYGWLQKYCASA